MRFFAPALAVAVFIVPSLGAANDDACSSVARIAESLMQRRQDGLSLQSTLDAMRSIQPDNKLLERMVISAYEVPRFATEKHIDRAVGKFRDEAHLACLKSR